MPPDQAAQYWAELARWVLQNSQRHPTWMEWVLFVVQILTLGAVFAYVIVTRRMASATKASADAAAAAVTEMKAAREAENRPYVMLYFDLRAGDPGVDLVVKNTGRSAARCVTFAFDTPLCDSRGHCVSEYSMFANGIPYMPPGFEIRTFFDMTHSIFPEARATHSWNVGVSYKEETLATQYAANEAIDLEVFRGVTWISRKGMHEMAEELRKIEYALSVTKDEAKRHSELLEEMFVTVGASEPTPACGTADEWKTLAHGELRDFGNRWRVLCQGDGSQFLSPRFWHLRRALMRSGLRLLDVAGACPEAELGDAASRLADLGGRVMVHSLFEFVSGPDRDEFEKTGNALLVEAHSLLDNLPLSDAPVAAMVQQMNGSAT